jgi:putative nucleotidyltransferase with HDIG domain
LRNEQLEQYLAEASDDLPTVPAVASRVISALDDPDTSLDQARELIESDPSITARILKVSNSSMYGFASSIQNLGQAISLIGSRAVRNLVMAVAMRETYTEFGELEQLLWEHSMAAGPTAAGLASEFVSDIDPDDAFTVGLIHDIGKTALANSHRAEYERVAKRAWEERVEFATIEREAFGFDHAELGARVLEGWSLPETVASVIRSHHDSSALAVLPTHEARLTALVTLTTACLDRLGAGRPASIDDLDITALEAWKFLGLSEPDRVLESCSERVEAARAFAS